MSTTPASFSDDVLDVSGDFWDGTVCRELARAIQADRRRIASYAMTMENNNKDKNKDKNEVKNQKLPRPIHLVLTARVPSPGTGHFWFNRDDCSNDVGSGSSLVPYGANLPVWKSEMAPRITSCDLSRLRSDKLIAIGDGFFEYCTNLQSINLAAFDRVHILGKNFLYGCSSLVRLDFTPIGANWAETAKLLLDDGAGSAGLGRMRSAPERFLNLCTSLHKVKGLAKMMSRVEDIGDFFMFRCESLTTLDLSGVWQTPKTSAAATVEPFSRFWTPAMALAFMSDVGGSGSSGRSCASAAAEASAATVRAGGGVKIGSHFLSGCSSLRSLTLPNVIRAIGSHFLNGCRSLESPLDLTPLTTSENVSPFFLCGCSSLAHVDLRPLMQSAKVNPSNRDMEGFMEGCNLNRVDGLPEKLEQWSTTAFRTISVFSHPPTPGVVHPLQKVMAWMARRVPVLIRYKSRGRWGELFQIWNVMTTVAMFLYVSPG